MCKYCTRNLRGIPAATIPFFVHAIDTWSHWFLHAGKGDPKFKTKVLGYRRFLSITLAQIAQSAVMDTHPAWAILAASALEVSVSSSSSSSSSPSLLSSSQSFSYSAGCVAIQQGQVGGCWYRGDKGYSRSRSSSSCGKSRPR